MMHNTIRVTLLALALLPFGCANFHRSAAESNYETIVADPYQNTDEAARLNDEAVTYIHQGYLDAAEKQLKAALEADVTYGLAHNNLGMVYYQQKKYYLAAWEFKYAMKLMPHRAEPKNNFGMVMERVGKYDESKTHYEAALEIEPDNPEITANLARLHIRQNEKDERTRQLLQDVIAKDTRQTWIDWANRLLATIQPKQKQEK